MEVYFLDVGQGTCQIILLGARRAIVIDCGTSKDRTVLHFLQRMVSTLPRTFSSEIWYFVRQLPQRNFIPRGSPNQSLPGPSHFCNSIDRGD